MYLYCIYFTVIGWRTAIIIGILFQCFSPKAIAWLVITIFKKSSWTKFLGERLSTLVDDATITACVTTFWDCGEFWESTTLDVSDGLLLVFNMVWCICLTGDVSTGWTRDTGCLFSAEFATVAVAWTGGLVSFFLKMAANDVSAVGCVVSNGGKRHIWMGVFQRVSHVLGSIYKLVHIGNLRHWRIVGEKFQSVHDAVAGCWCDLLILTSIMMHGWP